jgi:hypothetical protein
MAKNIHFLDGYLVFGLEDGKDKDSHFCLKMVVEHIPTKELDEPNGLRSGASLWTRHG